MWIGGLLILGGLLFLMGNLFHFDPWAFVWPAVLMVLGGWLLLRPSLKIPGAASTFLFIGNVNRAGAWQVQSQEFLFFIGDVVLDFTQAAIPVGETHLLVNGFIADVKLAIPADLGVKVKSGGFVSTVRLLAQRREGFFAGADLVTPGYEAASRKLVLEVVGFVTEVQVREGVAE
jgi:hypothetical protein